MSLPELAVPAMVAAEPPSRAEMLARAIAAEITDGGQRPGHRLGTKEELRRRFRVAAATVNQAVRLLEARGLIEARPGPGGGLFIAADSARVRLNHLMLGFRMDDAPFSDCLVVRNALEPLVCREAAAHCTPHDAAELRAIAERMRLASDPRASLLCNWSLHRRMAAIGSNRALRTLYLTLLDYLQDGLVAVGGDEDFDPQAIYLVHHELAEAVIDGNLPRLRAAIRAHEPTPDGVDI